LGANVCPPAGCSGPPVPGDGLDVVGAVLISGVEVLGLVVGNSGSVPPPQPGHVATPSTVLPQPASSAVSRKPAAIPARAPEEIRTRSDYAPSDWSDWSDSQGVT
jgi:hypothetical protein